MPAIRLAGEAQRLRSGLTERHQEAAGPLRL